MKNYEDFDEEKDLTVTISKKAGRILIIFVLCLFIGSLIIVSKPEKVTTNPDVIETFTTWVVENGDSYWSIASKCVNEYTPANYNDIRAYVLHIEKMNNHKELKAGDTIIVPVFKLKSEEG